jgi:hypothetical protein
MSIPDRLYACQGIHWFPVLANGSAGPTTDPRGRSSSGPGAADTFDRVLFPARLHDGLRDGSITLAFRSWMRPTVKEGGTLITPGGQLSIDRVVVVDPAAITEADAARTGSLLPDLRALLDRGEGRDVDRLGLRPDGPVAPT